MNNIANVKLPEDEIEITPEMIEAGAEELCTFNSDFESHEKAARRIYRAMVFALEKSR
jgi:hypothetical protein